MTYKCGGAFEGEKYPSSFLKIRNSINQAGPKAELTWALRQD